MNCNLCGKPFEKKIELGVRKFPVWLHDFPTLNECKALRFRQDFVKQLVTRDERVKKFLEEYGESGEPTVKIVSEKADS